MGRWYQRPEEKFPADNADSINAVTSALRPGGTIRAILALYLVGTPRVTTSHGRLCEKSPGFTLIVEKS